MRIELLVLLCVQESLCFWDEYTTTKKPPEKEEAIRTSFFMWQYVDFQSFLGFKNAPAYDYHVMRCRSLSSIAGISIGFVPITTAAILNRRTLITSANPLEPYIARQEDLRIWALGRHGMWNTPYRYRVYRWRRVLPRSVNPEHQVGARGRFTTRHDIAIVHSRDQV
ncbi:hypothetical protein O0L34_g2196 [Tuta absoluta]|nr:hypothetical protein O0L34_g2196 [Tuta absoluta]